MMMMMMIMTMKTTTAAAAAAAAVFQSTVGTSAYKLHKRIKVEVKKPSLQGHRNSP